MIAAPNYTQTPNVLFDELMPLMGDAELRVTLAIVRDTFGWQRQEHEMSLSYIQEKTGLSRQGALNGINAGMERGTIKRIESGQSFKYSIALVNEVDQQEQPSSQRSRPVEPESSQRSRPEVVNVVDTTNKGKKETTKEKTLLPAAPDVKDDSLQSKVFDVLESQYLTVNPLMVKTHTELAERYGFDAFLRGWEYCKPGTRHKASYLEKVILSHMTADETPDELKAKEAPQRIWCKHSTDFNASGWITIQGDKAIYEAKDSTTYTTQHPQWLKKIQAGEINDNLLGLFYTRGKAA